MRSRDLLLSGADYDWITNYYTKWITGHEISWTDTRTTKKTEFVQGADQLFHYELDRQGGGAILADVPLTPDENRLLYMANCYYWGAITPGGGQPTRDQCLRSFTAVHGGGPSDGSFYGIPDIVTHHGNGFDECAPGWGGSYQLVKYCYDKVKSKIKKGIFEGEETITQSDMNIINSRAFKQALSLAGASSISSKCHPEQYNIGRPSYSWWYDGDGSEPATSGVKTIQRETVYKLYRWTYYQTSQSTSRTTKWYTDKYSSTSMAGVDPNQRANGHLLSQTYYDRNDEVKKPAIGSISRPQALDPNSNKWMESREDRQANQSNSKNLYSNNKNELLQTPSNKRNLQTYYVHNEPVS